MVRVAKGLSILGSTGSIGTQTLDVVRAFPDDLRVVGLAARSSLELLGEQVREFAPDMVFCEGTAAEKAELASNGCRHASLMEMVCHPDVDLVVTATSGDVAVEPTFAAMEAGKDVALANKETVIMAGEMLTSHAAKHGVSLLPLDSEPNAIFQCLRGEERGAARLFITASGGAFRHTPLEELRNVTPEQALNHPTWSMGPKITVDSATMMNKAFEVIEAHWLFGIPWESIEVVIHPQSIIHSMVEFVDGSVKAQVSPPDMHLPIQYALLFPNRAYNESIRRFDPVATGALTFEPWDSEKYPCFDMGLRTAKRGGTWPAALCGADEMAVEKFLGGEIGFLEIGPVIEEALERHDDVAEPDLQDLLTASARAKEQVAKLVEGR